MSNLIIKCPKCGTDNPIDILNAEERNRILCKGCDEFLTLKFQDGKTPKKIKEDIMKEIQKAFTKKSKIQILR